MHKTATVSSRKRMPTAQPGTYGGRIYVWLRALSVLAVIGIHVVSSIPGRYFTGEHGQWVMALIDQSFRWSVPFYVLVSAFGLSQKYRDKQPGLFEVILSQFKKLLPAYVLASAGFYLAFTLMPSWGGYRYPADFFDVVLHGKADYHLYFVWLVTQLYLLFPVFFWLSRRLPSWLVLGIALIWQLGWYWWLGTPVDSSLRQQYAGDQDQYRWWFSWVWYFLLGMQLESWLRKLDTRPVWAMAIWAGVAASYFWTVWTAVWLMQHGTDPLMANRFTKIPVLVFATLTCIGLLWLARRMSNQISQRWMQPLQWLGAQSYPLYLWHTLGLRAIFTWLIHL